MVGGGGEGITLNLHKITPDIKRGRVAGFQEVVMWNLQLTYNLHKVTPDIKRGRVARFQEIARQEREQ